MVDLPAFLPNLNSSGRVIFFCATIWKPREPDRDRGERERENIADPPPPAPRTPGLPFCSHWLPTTLWPLVAFLLLSECYSISTTPGPSSHLPVRSTHHTQLHMCKAPEADASGHQPFARTVL